MPTRSPIGAKNKTGRTFPLVPSPVPNRLPLVERCISPANGRALEVLGHAIEYLADEYAFNALQMGTLDSGDSRVEAIQLLMSLNRQVYYSCPKAEPVLRRLAGWLFGGTPASRPEESSS